MDKGILTGCDERQEYLLKWWWNHYSKHNDYPVTFCDFGMTLSAKKWCESKGNVITQKSIPIQNLSQNIEHSPWKETLFPLMWNNRTSWFQKAFAQAQSPYNLSIWLDLDCEVVKNLHPCFDLIQEGDGFAICPYNATEKALALKRKILKEGTEGVQAGVFAYRKDSPVIPAWLQWCQDHHTQDFSEESCLSEMLKEKKYDIVYMSRNFNWTHVEQTNFQALVLHHASATRKRNLLLKISFND